MGPCIQLVCETINLQETSWPGQKRVLLGALLPRWVRLGQGALKRYLGADVGVNWPRSLTRAPNISDWDQNIVFLSDVWYDPNGSVHIHWHHWHQVLWKASMAVTTCRNHVACSGLQLFLHLWVQVQLSGPNPSVETLPETLPPDFPSRQ